MNRNNIGIGAGDCDSAWEPEPACREPECSDLLEQDLLGDWYCPTCTRKEQEANNE